MLLIAAAILAARKLAQYDGGKRVSETICAISDASDGQKKFCSGSMNVRR
jgi:hypothetical protein